MSRRVIVKNAAWCLAELVALPVVATLSLATGEHDKTRNLSSDIDKRINDILTDIEDEENEDKKEETDSAEGN